MAQENNVSKKGNAPYAGANHMVYSKLFLTYTMLYLSQTPTSTQW